MAEEVQARESALHRLPSDAGCIARAVERRAWRASRRARTAGDRTVVSNINVCVVVSVAAGGRLGSISVTGDADRAPVKRVGGWAEALGVAQPNSLSRPATVALSLHKSEGGAEWLCCQVRVSQWV